MFLLWLRQLPQCGDWTLVSVSSPAEGRSSPTNAPVFPPLPTSYRVLRDSLYPFPLVRYSCLLSAGVLHALLCLKVYSWCIHGERCTLCPPTPPPSCSLPIFFFLFLLHHMVCGILVPWQGIRPVLPAVAVQSLNYSATREVLLFYFIF